MVEHEAISAEQGLALAAGLTELHLARALPRCLRHHLMALGPATAVQLSACERSQVIT